MTNPEEHIDVEALQDLKEIMESEFETLINTFIQDSQHKIAQLEEVIGNGDAESMRKLAHSLKGSSSNICALSLSEFAKEIELLGKEGVIEGARSWLEKFKTEFNTVQKILNDYI